MKTEKIKIKILEANNSVIKVKFPYLEIPVLVTQRYFKKLIKSSQYIIEGVKYAG